MECGADELACHLIDWALSNGYVVKEAFDALDAVWKQAGWHIGQFLQQHGEKLVAIASFVFAVWKWWRYREKTLHKRLEEYIAESDARLAPTSDRVVETILRPGRTAALPQPAFAVELHNILDTNGWRSYFRFTSLERHVEKQLGRALKGIRKRERIVRAASKSLLEQQAQIHLLAGAVATSRAQCRRDRDRAMPYDHKALREFQEVLQSPGHHRDIVAKEAEAFQYMRLGQHSLAVAAYEQLEEYAADVVETRNREIVVARSKRYQAQIIQATSITPSQVAWNLIAARNDPTCSLNLRGRHVPYYEWDAIEQAEMHYVAAYIASKFPNWVNAEPDQLTAAEESYRALLEDLPTRSLLLPNLTKRLRNEANEGLGRVARARNRNYDLEWLMV